MPGARLADLSAVGRAVSGRTPMNWKECIELRESLNPGARFEWPPGGLTGFDCAVPMTISDVWGGLSWVWTWPGDYILSMEPLRTFFEIQPPGPIGTLASTFLGWVIFVVLCMASEFVELPFSRRD